MSKTQVCNREIFQPQVSTALIQDTAAQIEYKYSYKNKYKLKYKYNYKYKYSTRHCCSSDRIVLFVVKIKYRECVLSHTLCIFTHTMNFTQCVKTQWKRPNKCIGVAMHPKCKPFENTKWEKMKLMWFCAHSLSQAITELKFIRFGCQNKDMQSPNDLKTVRYPRCDNPNELRWHRMMTPTRSRHLGKWQPDNDTTVASKG